MPLPAGARVGSYEIVALIGAGGMGEVYRARDPRLNRSVALKVLPPAFAGNPDRLMRFEREAQALAALNHTNIAHIHGLEDTTLVMEFVEGEDLAGRLARGPLPIDEVLVIARQLVDALEAAHEHGIIHRDLKPANIKVRPDGTLKVLDFGLAKAIDGSSAAEALSPISAEQATQTSPALTKMGVILGTAAYMAPEQARGRVVDKRADIWAFGCVLFELLAGRPPFGGDTSTDVIAAAITTEPDWSALPPDTSAAMRRLLERCLRKDPRTRLRDIGDARWDLNDSAEPGTTAPPTERSRLATWLGAALVLVSVALGASLLWQRSGPATSPVRLSVTFPDAAPMQLGQSQPSLAYSPDGRTIVYTASGPEGRQLWLRDVNAFTATPIPGRAGGQLAFFSPDGKWIGFMALGALKTMPISLGPPTTICAYAGVPMGATWTSKGEIVFATRATAQSLWRVSSTGGTPVAITNVGVWYPDALPDGSAVVVTTNNPAATETTGDLSIAVVTLDDGKLTKLFDGGTYVRYSPTGHLIYLRNNALMAAPFDAATRKAGDTRAVVIEPVYMDQALVSGNFAISAAGALAYAPGDAQDFKRTIVTITPNGSVPLINERRAYRNPRVSPDGRHLAVIEQAWRDRIWLVDIERQSFVRLTSGRYLTESAPVWSPDGRQIAFRVVQEDQSVHILIAPSDGSGAERSVLAGLGEVVPLSWTADGQSLLFASQKAGNNADIMRVDVHDPSSVRPVLSTTYSEAQGALSPEGRRLAFVSNQTGRDEVYVTAFPSATPPVQVSTQGGGSPVWMRDGHRLVYRRGPDVMVVDLTSSGGTPTKPTMFASASPVLPGEAIDTMPDGRLVSISGNPIATTHELRVILQWFDELRQRVK